MKVKDFTKLTNYGFQKVIDKDDLPLIQYYKENKSETYNHNEYLKALKREERILQTHYIIEDEDDPFYYYNDLYYVYNIGHSRRGQFYYILVFTDYTIGLLATKPDGDGGFIEYPDVIIELFKDNLIEMNNVFTSAELTEKEALEVLKKYNSWRRGNEDIKQITPKKVGMAIDKAIEVLKLSISKQ